MAEQETSQADLLKQLEKSDVKVAGDKVSEMKENILKAESGGAWLGLGVHDVFIQSIELTQAKTGTLGMKFTVHNEDGKNEVTFWLSEAALPYTIENVSRLVVHNTTEAKKDAARNFMSNIVSAKELLKVAQEKLIDGVAVLVVKESKTQTYTTKTGEVRPSTERSLQSWKPKETDKSKVEKTMGQTSDIDLSELPF